MFENELQTDKDCLFKTGFVVFIKGRRIVKEDKHFFLNREKVMHKSYSWTTWKIGLIKESTRQEYIMLYRQETSLYKISNKGNQQLSFNA